MKYNPCSTLRPTMPQVKCISGDLDRSKDFGRYVCDATHLSYAVFCPLFGLFWNIFFWYVCSLLLHELNFIYTSLGVPETHLSSCGNLVLWTNPLSLAPVGHNCAHSLGCFMEQIHTTVFLVKGPLQLKISK